jgi:hypothetical protein
MMGVTGADTQGTTLVTTRERKEDLSLRVGVDAGVVLRR